MGSDEGQGKRKRYVLSSLRLYITRIYSHFFDRARLDRSSIHTIRRTQRCIYLNADLHDVWHPGADYTCVYPEV